jgi:hypothetical protein
MTNPLIQIDDKVRPMTNEELATYQLTLNEKATRDAELQAKAQAKAALLARLGITEAEAQLLLGGN